jgi:hypothetical protein
MTPPQGPVRPWDLVWVDRLHEDGAVRLDPPPRQVPMGDAERCYGVPAKERPAFVVGVVDNRQFVVLYCTSQAGSPTASPRIKLPFPLRGGRGSRTRESYVLHREPRATALRMLHPMRPPQPHRYEIDQLKRVLGVTALFGCDAPRP